MKSIIFKVEQNCNVCLSQASVPEQEPSDFRVEEEHTEVSVTNSTAAVDQDDSSNAPVNEGEHQQTKQQDVPAERQQPENEISEVDIPNVGRIMVRADADGYNEEVWTFWTMFDTTVFKAPLYYLLLCSGLNSRILKSLSIC